MNTWWQIHVGWRLRRLVCCFLGHVFSTGESGYGFDGYMDWYCARCQKRIRREPMEDALTRLTPRDQVFYRNAIQDKIQKKKDTP